MSESDERKAKAKAKAFLQEAYGLVTESDTLAFYERWADEYDAQLQRGLRYIAPSELARTLAKHQVIGDVPILDVGCGTGLTGCCLKELGFSTIDGLDFSTAMLSEARDKGVYRKLIEADLNAPLTLADGAYGAAISSGTFTLGHVGPEPLDELLRVLAPGAFLACTVHTEIWDSKGFSTKFDALQSAGTIRTVEQNTGRFFEGGDPVAKYGVFQKVP
jgi:predicted TPR repeat methyltransferase